MRYLIKRILIGVFIGVLLMIIKGNFLLIVNAESSSNDVIISTPHDRPVENLNNIFYSNVFYSTLDSNYMPQTEAQFINQIRPYPDDFNETITSSLFPLNGALPIANGNFGLNGRRDMSFSQYNYEVVSSIGRMWFIQPHFTDSSTGDYGTAFKMKKGSHYNILIEIEKANGIKYYGNSNSMALNKDTIGLTFIESGSETQIDARDLIDFDNIMVEWVSPNDITNGDKNIAYLLLRFEFENTIPDLDYYLDTLYFDSSTIVGVNANSGTPFMWNTDDNTKYFKFNKFVVIEDGEIDIYGDYNYIPNQYTDLDSISTKDLEIKDSLEQCQLGDFECYLNNIIEIIWDVLVRIGNFFNNIIQFFVNLFIPTKAQLQTLKDFFTMTISTLTDKLGFLIFPFEVIGTIFNLYINILTHNTSDYVINIPALREPFSNAIIYSGGTLDFGYIINYGYIKILYDIYYAFISVYIVLLFLDLCYDSFGSFISGNLHTSSTYTQQDLEMFNYDTGEVHTTSRVVKSSGRTIRS